jgi:dephospho-CoA kinase
MLTIGLTGGIASGKTTVSDLFSNLGVPIIDTDLISRHLLEIDQAGYQKVVEHFGDEILDKNQQIDRRTLRQLIFGNEAEKYWLEAVLHPIIFQQAQQQIELFSRSVYVIVVVPLLFETDFKSLVDRILVIDCSAETQIERLMRRDSIKPELARQMLDQQWNNEARLEQADDVIHNDNETDIALEQQVKRLHQKYLLLAS